MPELQTQDAVAALLEAHRGIQLDLGGGDHPHEGFINIDMRPGPKVDIVHDLQVFPWPLPDESVRRMIASHLLEHINPANFGFINFMNEAWRVCKPQGEFMISLPYAGSRGYWQDPTHCNGCNEVTFTYFDPLARDGTGELINLYTIYRPRPWKIEICEFNPFANMELLLRKRPMDWSYEG